MYHLRPFRRESMLPRFAEDLLRDFWEWPFEGYGFGFKVDIKEAKDHYLLLAELPGLDKDAIDLEIDGDYLTISVKNDETIEEEDEKRYIRRERRMMSCQRQFYVGDVKPEEIEARYHNGVLEIKIPKKEQGRFNRRIQIQ